MTESTLAVWIVVYAVGVLAFIVLGRLNVYVTKEQISEIIANRETPDYAKYYVLTIKFRVQQSAVFILMASLIVIISVLFFIMDFSDAYKTILGDDAFGLFMGIFIYLVVAIFSFIIWVACFCVMQENSIEYIKRHFSEHYDIQNFCIDE